MKFYKCAICGNIIVKLEDSGVVPYCCGSKMDEIVVQEEEMNFEKHIPVCKQIGNEVCIYIGNTLHPMTKEHYIKWVVIELEDGFKIHYFKDGDVPETCIRLSNNEKIKHIYGYCNIHGLYKGLCEPC